MSFDDGKQVPKRDDGLNAFQLRVKMGGFVLENIKVRLNASRLEICGTNEINDVSEKPFKYSKQYLKKIPLPNSATVDSIKYYFDSDNEHLIVEFLSNITNKEFFNDFVDNSSDNGHCATVLDSVAKGLTTQSKNIFEIKNAIQREFNKSD
jgi:hypothetical protein